MSSQPIDPVSDPRIHHKTAVLNGYTYHYLYAEPKSGQYSQTVFLVWNIPYLDMSRRIYRA
jgi:soluble epoxide hydrolase/lipid-phosphate phosphatase